MQYFLQGGAYYLYVKWSQFLMLISYHLFSLRGSLQDYKIHMDMVTVNNDGYGNSQQWA